MATDDKYDRQLRLWGPNGQRALGSTNVILVGGTAAGTETLKNLVLPGIGSYNVIDDAFVSRNDVASNFFVTTTSSSSSSVPESRASAACRNLQELNPDVVGSFRHLPNKLSDVGDWKAVLLRKEEEGTTTEQPPPPTTKQSDDGGDDENKDKKQKKHLVIASDLDRTVLERLSEAVCALRWPLVVVRSYGLIGTVKLQLPGRNVPLLDPKPANSPPDLRLKTGFPALDAMCDSIDLGKLDDKDHAHVPYPIVLRKAILAWRESSRGGVDPKTFAEKGAFKDAIKAMSRDLTKEVNFEEAVQHSYLAYTEREVHPPDGLEDEKDDKDDDDDDGSKLLGKLFRALETFRKDHDGRPPLNGSIPDMTSSTSLYVRLQQIYKAQAERDLEDMRRLTDGGVVKDGDLRSFCSNVFSVGSISTRTVAQEISEPLDVEAVDELKMGLMDAYEVPVHTPLLWYLGIAACQAFRQKNGRYPGTPATTRSDGSDDDDWESDVPLLVEDYKVAAKHRGLESEPLVVAHSEDVCHELARCGNAELHCVASVVGGVASQEAVKIITGQYVPLDGTYVYNGIVSVAGVYKV